MKNISFVRNGKEFEPTKNELKIVLNDYAKKIGELETKLAQFEDFIEEQGFEGLEELKYSYDTIKKSQASTHFALMTINEELVGTRQFIIKQIKENKALKAKIQELEFADLIRKKGEVGRNGT